MSSTSNAPAPTSISSCIPTAIESFDTSGLSGLVCGISAPPAVHNISSCCATDTWKVESNCTQYCEAHDAGEFNNCVNEHRNFLIDSGSNDSSLPPIYNSLCLSGSDSGDEDESESQAGRSAVWGYSVLMLVVSTIAFGMAP